MTKNQEEEEEQEEKQEEEGESRRRKLFMQAAEGERNVHRLCDNLLANGRLR